MLSENHLDDTCAKWFAIRTKYKDEKMALKQLELKGIEAYLPIKKLVRKYGTKIREIEMPLIHSFVFVKIRKEEYIPVLETEYVSSFLKFGKNLLSIPDFQIELIKRLVGAKIELSAEKEYFGLGDAVEIINGPLLGLKGRLVNIKGKDKMVVELVNLEHSLLLDIDTSQLKRV
jgi:transcription antitermination factor NusG